MNIKIDRNSDFARKLYEDATNRIGSILSNRKKKREKILNKYRGLKGERYGFLWLKKRERDETDEEVENSLNFSDVFDLYEAETYCWNQLEICESYVRVFESGQEFSISPEELRYIR